MAAQGRQVLLPTTTEEWRALFLSTARLAEELVLELQIKCDAPEHGDQLAWLRMWKDEVEA